MRVVFCNKHICLLRCTVHIVLSSGRVRVSGPAVITIKVVKIRLNSGEEYEYGEAYTRAKDILHEASMGIATRIPWQAMNMCYRFSQPLEEEKKCIEIVMLKKIAWFCILCVDNKNGAESYKVLYI